MSEVEDLLATLASQTKKVEREARIAKQVAAQLRDALQAQEATRKNEQDDTNTVEEE